jgi:3-phytase
MFTLGCSPDRVRFATFNASLNRDKPGQLLQDLAKGDDPQIRNVAEIIQRMRPDVLLINEFDFDETDRAFGLFVKNYLEKSQNGAEPISYRYHFVAPVNTGIHSGHDLDNNGKVVSEIGSRDYGGDALGFGLFPGQYGMMLLSKYPVDTKNVRTFQRFKWKDMPGAMLPTKVDGSPWYDEAELNVLRLSSKSHWDVPVKIGSKFVHVLASHPTPPAFDGPEDRNGKRNHDEIRLWADYLSGGSEASYLRDDANRQGSFIKESPFVVLGDLNADPHDGGSVQGAVQQLLDHPLINSSLVPSSTGAAEASNLQAGKNAEHRSPAYEDTADFPDTGTNGPGNLRCDYVLPGKAGISILEGGVFWPKHDDPLYRLVNMEPTAASSDHRLVWVDLRLK